MVCLHNNGFRCDLKATILGVGYDRDQIIGYIAFDQMSLIYVVRWDWLLVIGPGLRGMVDG